MSSCQEALDGPCFASTDSVNRQWFLLLELLWRTMSSLWSCRWDGGKPASELRRQHWQHSSPFPFLRWKGKEKKKSPEVDFSHVCFCAYTECVYWCMNLSWKSEEDHSCEREKTTSCCVPWNSWMKNEFTSDFYTLLQLHKDAHKKEAAIVIFYCLSLLFVCFIKWIQMNTIIQIMINVVTLEKR